MKKYFSIFVLLFISLISFDVYAYNLTCDSSVHKVGDTFSCKVEGDSTPYNKLSGTIESDDYLSCVKANVSPGLSVLEDSTDNYFNLSGTPSVKDLILLTCKVVKNPDDAINTSVYINDFTYHIEGSSSEKSEILKSDFIKLEHKKEETPVDTKPRDISDPSVRPRRLTSKELDITFSQFITEYTVEVLFDTEEVTFDYELNDQTSTLRIEGSTKLDVGKNTIDIYITNADGSKEACYTFYIERLARGEEIYYPESDSTLKSMVIPGYSIGFKTDTLEYKIHLANDVKFVNINTVPNYEQATVSISNSDNLKNGDVIAVEVTSADETSKTTYKIYVTKDAPKKDYSTIIIISLLALAFVGTIVMFIITNNKKKSDPLLSIKTNKRKVNKGKNFDASIVPVSNNTTAENNNEENKEDINTLNLNSENTVAPIQTDKVEIDSFNQISSVKENVDLNTNITPTEVEPQELNANLGQNTNQQTISETNPQVIKQEENTQTQVVGVMNQTENYSNNTINQVSENPNIQNNVVPNNTGLENQNTNQ